jgi:hypothetical protein
MEIIRRPVLLIRPDVKVTQSVLASRVGTGNYWFSSRCDDDGLLFAWLPG